MKPHYRTLLLAFLLVPPSPLLAQVSQWESMGGPLSPEKRVHLRYPDGDRLFIGNLTGTYRTSDGGITWACLSPPPAPNFSVFLSSSGTLLGVGDTATFSTDKHDIVATVVYASTDRGAHWIKSSWGRTAGVCVAFGGGDTIYRTYGYAWNGPPGALYVARSTNAGLSWETVLQYLPWSTSLGGRGFLDVYTQPHNVFVRVWGEPAAIEEVQRSSDGGATWKSITANRVMFHPPNNLLRKRRDWLGSTFSAKEYIDLSTDDGGTWTTTVTADSGFATLVTNNLGTILALRKPGYELVRSQNAGLSWTSLGQGAVPDPLTSVSFFGTTFLVGRTRNGVYLRSTNLGNSWVPILDAHGAPLAGTVQSATDSLFVIADGTGKWLESNDAGATWRSCPFSYEKTRVTSLLTVPSGSLFAGTSGSLFRKRGDEDWLQVPSPVSAGPFSAGVWSLSYRGGLLFHAVTGKSGTSPQVSEGNVNGLDTSVVASGRSWRAAGLNQWTYGYQGYDFRSVFSLGEGRALAGSKYVLVNAISGGSSPGQSLTGPGWFTAIVKDSVGKLWASNDSTGLFSSSNSGASWNPSDSGLANLKVLSMTVARNGFLFAGTIRGGVFRSTDGGDSWMLSGLPGQTVQALASGRESRIYAGTPEGVRTSTNNGETWTDISSGLTNSDIRAVTVADDGNVYCGTWGDGVYLLRDIGLAAPSIASPADFWLSQNFPNPFNPTTVVRYSVPSQMGRGFVPTTGRDGQLPAPSGVEGPVFSGVRLVVYDILGREVAVLVNERQEAGVHEVRFDAPELASGVYVYRLTAGRYVESRKMLLLK